MSIESKRANNRKYAKATYNRRRAAGLCVRCGQPHPDTESRCESCRLNEKMTRPDQENTLERQEQKNQFIRRRYAERRAAGRCVDCNAPSSGPTRCLRCRVRNEANRKAGEARDVSRMHRMVA